MVTNNDDEFGGEAWIALRVAVPVLLAVAVALSKVLGFVAMVAIVASGRVEI